MRRVNVDNVTLIFLLLLVLITGFSMSPVIRDPTAAQFYYSCRLLLLCLVVYDYELPGGYKVHSYSARGWGGQKFSLLIRIAPTRTVL